MQQQKEETCASTLNTALLLNNFLHMELQNSSRMAPESSPNPAAGTEQVSTRLAAAPIAELDSGTSTGRGMQPWNKKATCNGYRSTVPNLREILDVW